MHSPHSYVYHTFEGLELRASLYEATDNVKNHAILYLHGGGLVYGVKDDLPTVFKELLLSHGYHLITLDYPLAPETPLAQIYQCLTRGVQWFIEQSALNTDVSVIQEESALKTTDEFSLFGRSAGGYLALLLARDKKLPTPTRVIDFYGYDSLLNPSFQKPNRHYLKSAHIPETLVKRMVGNKPIAYGPIQSRFALYLYARQSGKWLELLGVNQTVAEEFSLTKEDIECLPPVFITHSKNDTDVPFEISERLSQEIPNNHFYPVNHPEHDFDRDTDSAQSKGAYHQLIEWLQTPQTEESFK